MSAPKRWQMSDGEVAQVHTPFTTRAKELMELYNRPAAPLALGSSRFCSSLCSSASCSCPRATPSH